MKNRQDIQALRGVAVLMVVVFHARLGYLVGGYLGVDVFFVLSGFLITMMVTSQVQSGQFSFRDFYFRRAKRLLPAAYTTFLFTALLSAWLLTSQEFSQFVQQLIGAVTFTSNIVLWRQGSYFGGEADLKPLLHTWSLAIEEQYYMLLPAALCFIPSRHWLKAILIGTSVSVAMCVVVMTWRPDVAFYFFPTRAWELGVGSVGVFLSQMPKVEPWAKRAFWPALALLLTLPIYPLSNAHPGIDAWLVCWATLVVILARHPWMNGSAAMSVLSKVGDWSYSLYLVHWPIFALAANVWVGETPALVKWAGIVLSLLVSYAQYTWVENPIRKSPISPSLGRVSLILCGSFVLVLMPLAFLHFSPSHQDYAKIRRGNTGLSPSCAFDQRFQPGATCQSGPDPSVLVWGDSYAMHLIPGIKMELKNDHLLQATKYVCGPVLGLAPIAHYPGATQNRLWAEGCMRFNDSVIDFLRQNSAIKTVVLSSVFKQYMTPEDFHDLVRVKLGLIEEEGAVERAVLAMGYTIESVRTLGKKVILVAPPPAMDWDAGRCAERIMRGMLVLGNDADCVTKNADYQKKRANVLAFLDQVRRRFDVEVISFDTALRAGEGYMPVADDKILFISNGHLSYDGSEYLARKIELADRILKGAK